MKKSVLAFLIMAAATTASAQQTLEFQAGKQKGLLQTLIDAAGAGADGLKQLLAQVIKGKPLPPDLMVQVMREVEDRLKPVPLGPAAFQPVLPQEPLNQYRKLTAAEERLLLDRAASVAQLEHEVGSGRSLLAVGTGFVIGPALIATNCHVLSQIAKGNSDGTWQLQPGAQAHFNYAPAHDAAFEFTITGVAAVPSKPGLDVALLHVNARSTDGKAALPKPLKVRAARLAGWTPERGMPIALVGYPSVDLSSELNYVELRKHGNFGRIYSPGAVMDTTTVEHVDILNHIASTTQGSSGSPLFDLDNFEVIGVHSCCTGAGKPLPQTLPCATIMQSQPQHNHAIAATTILTDPVLQKVLKAN